MESNELLAVIDLGTNSARMSLVRVSPQTGTWTLQSQEKETVRLGQGEFAPGHTGLLTEAAMERGVLALRRFAEMARGRGAAEIVAVGTAALREAENRDDFIERVRGVADVEVGVVSGVEEARLIYLGVASGMEIGERTALFIDIGGGSTELILGTQTEHKMLDSLKMGAIRVASRFLSGLTEAIPADLYAEIQQYVRSVLVPAQRKIETIGFEIAVASSGSAMNLASTNAKRHDAAGRTGNPNILTREDLAETAQYLCGLTLEERRHIPGLNPERADIIIAGAAILQTIAEELDIATLHISDRSLREGIIVDALLRSGDSQAFEAGIRRRTVEEILRRTLAETVHARQVARIALRLFDDLHALGFHDNGRETRDLVEYAALLHDIGVFIAHTGHHRHSHYLIKHAEMAGFTNTEKDGIANLAYFHRKSPPSRKRHPHFVELPAEMQTIVRRFSPLLRLAEGLDRSHLSLVEDVRLERTDNGLRLMLIAERDPDLEIYYVAGEKAYFEEAWGTPLEVLHASPVQEASAV